MITPLQAPRRAGAALVVLTAIAGGLLVLEVPADGAIVATVPLGMTAANVVLAGSTVTNTGASTLDGNLGLAPGSTVTGFPPGLVLAPGSIDIANGVAQQAQSDLTVAYVNAAGRPINASTPADLANLTLQGGVYAGPAKSPLGLTGPLVLDGAGNPNSVFIFQTDSTLITASGSTVQMINGAQECNVFWQVGSSATLGTNSVFRGNILALTSITVTTGVTVYGRALARNGAVTLDTNTFVKPGCVQFTTDAETTTTTAGQTTTTTGTATDTTGGGTATTTSTGTPGSLASPTTAPGSRTAGPIRGGGTSTGITRRTTTQVLQPPGGPGVPAVVGPPRTGGAPSPAGGFPFPAVAVFAALCAGATLTAVRARRPLREHPSPARP